MYTVYYTAYLLPMLVLCVSVVHVFGVYFYRLVTPPMSIILILLSH